MGIGAGTGLIWLILLGGALLSDRLERRIAPQERGPTQLAAGSPRGDRPHHFALRRSTHSQHGTLQMAWLASGGFDLAVGLELAQQQTELLR